jgi:hypothetical protein
MHYVPVAPPPQTTAIFRNFKKSTTTCKVHNLGLRYINVLFTLYKGGGEWGSGLQTDKHLPQSPFTGQIFR